MVTAADWFLIGPIGLVDRSMDYHLRGWRFETRASTVKLLLTWMLSKRQPCCAQLIYITWMLCTAQRPWPSIRAVHGTEFMDAVHGTKTMAFIRTWTLAIWKWPWHTIFLPHTFSFCKYVQCAQGNIKTPFHVDFAVIVGNGGNSAWKLIFSYILNYIIESSFK